ncbi:MAG: lysostaphin resistance A-like protein [Halobacteriales archaeon]
MPDWPLFAAVTGLVGLAFVALARASARAVRAALDAHRVQDAPPPPAVAALQSDRLVVVNVVATHGLLLVILAAGAWTAGVPAAALGVAAPTPRALAAGVGLGLALAAGNEAGARLAERAGLTQDERLRELLAPESAAGWTGLLFVVLPLVATAEELLFRGALVGGLAAGFDLPVWGLVVGSSAAFGVGHVMQGRAGVAVTAGLGLVLAGGFVITGSLAVVVIAHYVVNAAEFLGHERPTGRP